MEALSKNKNIVGLIIFIALALFLYSTFIQIDNEAAPAPTAIGEDLVAIAKELSEATLSQTLFSLPGFIMLSDFSTPIPQEPLGRTNPFDLRGR